MAQLTTLFDVVEQCAREAGDAVAAIDGIVASTPSQEPRPQAVLPPVLRYAELAQAAARVAAALADCLGRGDDAIATCMPRGNDWYCTFLAAAKLGVALAALSTDLRNKEVEQRRNEELVATAQPSLAVVAEPPSAAVAEILASLRVVAFSELWTAGRALAPGFSAGIAAGGADRTLCYCFTGGTTKASRCARVTQGMALHEVAAYPRIVSLKSADRVLQQHSLYWAASAYGEVDIALAFRCALVFCEVGDADSVASAIQEHRITCAGLVPSVLSSLEPDSLPDLRLIFTWGEALGARTAREWTCRAKVVDLLISTECWLSLYAVWEPTSLCAAGDRPAFHVVPGAQVRLEGSAEGEGTSTAGELLVAGPMVTPGYTDTEMNASVFLEEDGVRWYRTRDRLEQREAGLVFAGRADDLVKVGGVWLDTAELQRQLLELEGVAEVAITGSRHAFVALSSPARPGVLPEVRRMLPADFSLLLLPQLPRDVGTNKVDRRALAGVASSGATYSELEEAKRCQRQFARLRRWYLPVSTVGLGAVGWAVFACWPRTGAAAPAAAAAPEGGAAGGAAVQLLAIGRRWAWELSWRSACTAYMSLLPWYADWAWQETASRYLPFGLWGAVLLAGAGAPGPCSGAALAAPGVYLAVRRGRLLSWPFVCVFGFPLWAEEAGGWWVRQGFSGSLWWYLDMLAGPLKPARDYVVKASRNVQRRMNLLRECAACQATCSIAEGHVSEEDALWYCDACWAFYHKHQQCSACREWKVRGQLDASGAWVCAPCSRSGQGQGQGDQGFDRQRALVLSDAAVAAISAEGAGQVALGASGSTGGTETEAQPACSAGSPGSRCPAAGEPSEDTSPQADRCAEWRLIERVTGWTFRSRDDSIAGLDSLRMTKVISALRRETGRRVPSDRFRRCATLGDLLLELQRLPVEPTAEGTAAPTHEACRRTEWATWGMMWTSKCGWCLHRDRPLAEPVLRAALLGLAERHPSLCAKLCDPLPLYTATQRAFTMFALWQHCGCPGTHPGLAAMVCKGTRWAFRRAWPRSGSRLPAEPPLTVLPHSETAEQAKQACKGHPFEPPFQASLAAYGAEGRQEGAFVQLQVTHMFSDGYSIVPMLSDLAHLIALAENVVLPPLSPVPNAMAAFEQRLMRTINGDDSMTDIITPEPLNKPWTREKVAIFSPVPEQLVSALKRCARNLGVSADIVMLSVICVALAHLEGFGTPTVVLVIPQRDGPAEGELVGLFADFRVLQVTCEGLSVAGVALQLHRIVKERLWSTPGLTTQWAWPFVNFQWTDLEAHHGLQQINELNFRSERLKNPAGIVVEQPDPRSWRVRSAFDKRRYSVEAQERYFQGLVMALEAFVTDPLAPAWPPADAASSGRHA